MAEITSDQAGIGGVGEGGGRFLMDAGGLGLRRSWTRQP